MNEISCVNRLRSSAGQSCGSVSSGRTRPRRGESSPPFSVASSSPSRTTDPASCSRILPYARGYIKRGDDEHKFQFDVAFNEYGHLGSPIFNSSGHLVGISYKEGDAWSVSFLQWAVFSRAEIRSLLGTVSYVLKGNPIPAEGPVLPDGAVPPNLVQPDMAPHQQMENI